MTRFCNNKDRVLLPDLILYIVGNKDFGSFSKIFLAILKIFTAVKKTAKSSESARKTF